jgi:hypothetical protein
MKRILTVLSVASVLVPSLAFGAETVTAEQLAEYFSFVAIVDNDVAAAIQSREDVTVDLETGTVVFDNLVVVSEAFMDWLESPEGSTRRIDVTTPLLLGERTLTLDSCKVTGFEPVPFGASTLDAWIQTQLQAVGKCTIKIQYGEITIGTDWSV